MVSKRAFIRQTKLYGCWHLVICWSVITLVLSEFAGFSTRFSAKVTRISWHIFAYLQYTPRNMHTALALLCFVVVMYWLIYPYPSGLLHWHCGNLTIAPVPAKQPWWIWVNASCEFIMNDYITTTKQSTTKPCANCLGYNVCLHTYASTTVCSMYTSQPFYRR